MERARRTLRRFAAMAESGESPLYGTLAAAAAADPEMVAVAAAAPVGQPPANLLLGAVHYLLLGGIEHDLAQWYPSVAGRPAGPVPYTAFQAFVREHRAAVVDLIRTRRVQTNEVQRSAILLPLLTEVAEWSRRPLRLIEIGTSAGLNLAFDRYSYDYGSAGTIGGGLPSLRCEVKGETPPPLAKEFPHVADRIGIDLHPVDVGAVAEARWLCALVWPDRPDRMARLEQAMAAAAADPPHVIAGDGLELAPREAADSPADVLPVVFHTFAMYQESAERRRQLEAELCAVSERRPVVWVSFEWIGDELPFLETTVYDDGTPQLYPRGHAHHHGAWIEWQSVHRLR